MLVPSAHVPFVSNIGSSNNVLIVIIFTVNCLFGAVAYSFILDSRLEELRWKMHNKMPLIMIY